MACSSVRCRHCSSRCTYLHTHTWRASADMDSEFTVDWVGGWASNQEAMHVCNALRHAVPAAQNEGIEL